MNSSEQNLTAATGSNNHWLWLGSFISIACLLGYGYYLQYVEYLDPCPLCMTQRFFYYLFAAAAIVGFFTVSKMGLQRFLGAFATLAAIGGVVTAGRQVWLQHLPPDQVPACGPGLEYWLETMPFTQTLQLLFMGDGNCAEVHWRFLGFSIGEWSLAWFVLFTLIGLKILFTRRKTIQ